MGRRDRLRVVVVDGDERENWRRKGKKEHELVKQAYIVITEQKTRSEKVGKINLFLLFNNTESWENFGSKKIN